MEYSADALLNSILDQFHNRGKVIFISFHSGGLSLSDNPITTRDQAKIITEVKAKANWDLENVDIFWEVQRAFQVLHSQDFLGESEV